MVCRSDGSDISAWTAQVIADNLFLCCSENAHAEVFREDDARPEHVAPFDIVLEVNCLLCEGGAMAIRLAALAGPSRRQVWSGQCTASLRGGPPIDDAAVLRLMNSAVEAIMFDRASSDGDGDADRADTLLRGAIGKIFSMHPDRIDEADEMLARAYELRPSSLYLAWRLQIRTIRRLERHVTDEQQLREEGAFLAARALEEDSGNSMVLSLMANAQLFLFRDPRASLHFARLGARLNPGNPMASWAISSAGCTRAMPGEPTTKPCAGGRWFSTRPGGSSGTCNLPRRR